MYSSRMKETRGFLAVIMALVMVFAGVALLDANSVDAGEEISKAVVVERLDGTTASYDSLADMAWHEFDDEVKQITINQDISEDLTDPVFFGKMVSGNSEGVVITNTVNDYMYLDTVFIGEGIHLKSNAMFFQGGTNYVEGIVEVVGPNGVYYQGYDATVIVQNGGSIVVDGSTILRYNKDPNAGLYIYGDGDESTTEFSCSYYIGAYSGTFYAEDASIDAGYFLLKNFFDSPDNGKYGYSGITLQLDNAVLEMVGTSDGQGQFITDNDSSIVLSNNSSIEVIDNHKFQITETVELDVDETSTIIADNVANVKDSTGFLDALNDSSIDIVNVTGSFNVENDGIDTNVNRPLMFYGNNNTITFEDEQINFKGQNTVITNLNVINNEVDGDESTDAVLFFYGDNVSISGCSFSGTSDYAVSFAHNVSATNGSVITLTNTDFGNKKVTMMNGCSSGRTYDIVNCSDIYLNVANEGLIFDGDNATNTNSVINIDDKSNIGTISFTESIIDLNQTVLDVEVLNAKGDNALIKNGSLNAGIINSYEDKGKPVAVQDIQLSADVQGVDIQVIDGSLTVPVDGELTIGAGSNVVLSSGTTFKVIGSVNGDGRIVSDEISEGDVEPVVEALNPDSLESLVDGIEVESIDKPADGSGEVWYLTKDEILEKDTGDVQYKVKIDLMGHTLTVNSDANFNVYYDIVSTGKTGTVILNVAGSMVVCTDHEADGVQFSNVVFNKTSSSDWIITLNHMGNGVQFNDCEFIGAGKNAMYVCSDSSNFDLEMTDCDFGETNGIWLEFNQSNNQGYMFNNTDISKLVVVPLNPEVTVEWGTDIVLDEDSSVTSVVFDTIAVSGDSDAYRQVELIVPEGEVFTADSVTGSGKIVAEEGSSVNVLTSSVPITGDVGTNVEYECSSVSDIISILNSDSKADVTLKVDKAVLTENIILKSGQTLNIIGTTLTLPKTTGSISVGDYIYVPEGATLNIESSDIRVPVIVDEGADVIITKAKKMTVDGDATADLGVGYGNTLVLSNLTVPAGKSIDAYGNVVIEGNVTVQKGANFNVYAGGLATVDGNLVIEGKADVRGDMDITGTVKVYYAEGGAEFKTGTIPYQYYAVATGQTVPTLHNGVFTPEVIVTGTMDVLKGKTKGTTNTLDATAGIVIEGTLTVTGTLSGKVADMGTITFNGKAATGTTITVFDGVTLTIAAVDGEITINDMDIVDEEYTVAKGYYVSENNQVKIEDVKNVTVSVVLNETTVKVNDVSKRLISSEMTVIGTIASIDDSEDADYSEKITITGAGAVEYDDENDKSVQGKVIIGDVTLGKEVVMEIESDNVVVAGTVTVSAEKSDLTIDDGKVIDITGTIVNYQKDKVVLDIDGKFNGAYYNTVDADLEKTYYFTTFENAIAAVADAEDNEITVSGEIEIASEIEIPAGAEVLMDNGDRMLIDVDGKLTVASTALLSASGAYIKVDGMLVIMDKESGFEAPAKNDFIYQVYTVSGETETYSGLVLALKNAVAGDVISVVGETGTITKSVTIPEGVTLEVPKNTKLTVGDAEDKEKVVLTVAGTLKVDGTLAIAENTSSVTEIAVPGVIMTTMTEFPDEEITGGYVDFKMKVDGKENQVYSNLAYAAENASYGAVAIVGDVSGGDVTFTMGEKASTFGITVNSGAKLSVGTMTIIGNGAVFTATGEVTGTIAAAAGSVDLNKVSGITMTVVIDEDVDGATDLFKVYSTTKLVGKMTVATGIITINDVDGTKTLTVGDSKDNVLVVDEGATLAVPTGATLAVSAMTIAPGVVQYYGLIIDGTLAIEDGAISADVAAEILINGTMTVSKKDVTMAGKLFVNGTLSVISTDEEKAKMNVTGAVILGTAPAIGANGTLSGPIDIINNAYIIAYAGADVSAALIDINESTGESTAKSTEIVLNGVPYMTVYVDSNGKVPLNTLAGFLEVKGFETEIDWEDPVSGTTEIGVFDKVEGTLTAAKTKLTVSAGVGLKVYIDGLAIENFYGKYDINDTADPDDYVTGHWIQFGTHTVSFAVESGYDGANATITVNGVQVSNNGTFTVDVDDKDVVIIASGAVPAQSGSTVVVDDADDGMALTDILLIVLVVLIVIMAIIVALRMMRS